MLNRAQLIGNLGRDPEIRSTQNGDRIANFSLATSESWKDKNSGERKTRSEWHRVCVFNPHLVDVVEKFMRKGSKVYVEGQIQSRQWTDKDGNQKTAFEIVLQRFGGQIILLDGKPASESSVPDQQSAGSDLNDEIPW